MKSKILLIVGISLMSTATSIRGATPDLKESLKTEIEKVSEKIAITSAVQNVNELIFIKSIYEDVSFLSVEQKENSGIIFVPTKAISKFSKNCRKSENKKKNSKYRKPRDGI